MATYTLSIEDRVGIGVNVTERAVIVIADSNIYLMYEEVYNPTAECKKPSNHEDREFDTPFSIVHPFREAAMMTSQYAIRTHDSKPVIKYDCSVNDAQRRLFGNIFAQENYKVQYGQEEATCREFLAKFGNIFAQENYKVQYGQEEATCREFLAKLPEECVFERAGFQSRLDELEQERLKLGIK